MRRIQQKRERKSKMRELKRSFIAQLGYVTLTGIRRLFQTPRTRMETIVLRRMRRAVEAKYADFKSS